MNLCDLRHLTMLEVPPKTRILAEGELCECFYIILSGKLLASSTVLQDSSQEAQVLLTTGMTFGEKALNPLVTKTPAVTTVGSCILMVLSGSEYRSVMAANTHPTV